MGRTLTRQIVTVGADGRARAHAGVLTTLDHRVAPESFDDFCARQLSRVKHTLGYRASSYRRRRATLLGWAHAGLDVQTRGAKQPMGTGSYATREAVDREEDAS